MQHGICGKPDELEKEHRSSIVLTLFNYTVPYHHYPSLWPSLPSATWSDRTKAFPTSRLATVLNPERLWNGLGSTNKALYSSPSKRLSSLFVPSASAFL